MEYAELNGNIYFSRYPPEILFLGKVGPKIQNWQFKLKFGTYTNSKIQNSVLMFTFFDFTQEILFLSKFDSKKQNCQFKLEIIVPILIGICRTKWWCLLFPFSTGKTLFWVNFVPQIQNWKFKLKPGTLSNSNKQNWMVVLTLSVIDPKHSFFYANLVLETKIVSLTWNLVLMLIRIWRTHWWCSLFLILTANTFFGWSWSKKSKLSLYSKIWCLG